MYILYYISPKLAFITYCFCWAKERESMAAPTNRSSEGARAEEASSKAIKGAQQQQRHRQRLPENQGPNHNTNNTILFPNNLCTNTHSPPHSFHFPLNSPRFLQSIYKRKNATLLISTVRGKVMVIQTLRG